MHVVVSLNPDGTAAVTTPIPQAGETAREAAERVAAGIPGGEVLSAELVAALRRADTPAPGSLVPVAAFRERIVMAYLRLGAKPAEVQATWNRVIRDYLPPDRGPVNLASPTTTALLAAAVADGLLTEAEATAAAAH